MSKDHKLSTKYSVFFILLCLLGSWISWQTVIVHFQTKNGLAGAGGVCNISQEFNCQAVVNSNWSTIAGLPLGAFGIVFYLSLICLLLQSYYSKFWSQRQLFILYTPALILSALASIFLFCISKFVVQVICPLCLMLYLVSFLLLILVIVVIRQSEGTVLAVVFREYRQLIIDFKNALVQIKIAALGEYLLSLGLIAVTILGIMVALRFSEYNYKTQVVSWPVKEKLAIDLKLEPGINSDYYFGDLTAPIQIVEFADFQCPFCRMLGSQVKDWLSGYQGKYYFVYLNYPLDQSCNPDMKRPLHQVACYLAELSRCAGEQGKFWEAYYYLVRLDEESFQGGVREGEEQILQKLLPFAGLEESAVRSCLDSGRQIVNIQEDIQRARMHQVTGTPALFINGQKVSNISERTIHNIMDKILEK